jgi:hypothetical protein
MTRRCQLVENSPAYRMKLTEHSLRHILPAVYGQLGRANMQRLTTLVALFRRDETVNLQVALELTFPDQPNSARLKQFSNFRGDVNKAAKRAKVDLVFRADNYKRMLAENRECWFETATKVPAHVAGSRSYLVSYRNGDATIHLMRQYGTSVVDACTPIEKSGAEIVSCILST